MVKWLIWTAAMGGLAWILVEAGRRDIAADKQKKGEFDDAVKALPEADQTTVSALVMKHDKYFVVGAVILVFCYLDLQIMNLLLHSSLGSLHLLGFAVCLLIQLAGLICSIAAGILALMTIRDIKRAVKHSEQQDVFERWIKKKRFILYCFYIGYFCIVVLDIV